MPLIARPRPPLLLAGSLVAILLLAPACAPRVAGPAAGTAPSPSDDLAGLPAPGSPPVVTTVGRPGDGLPRIEISISCLANLIHWIDNLAGTSIGKTIRAYRTYWIEKFGPPSDRDRDLLTAWRRIRLKAIEMPDPEPILDRGCLPQVEQIPSWRHRFQVRSYEAASVDEFVDSMSEELTPREIATLRAVIESFQPRFEEIWGEMTYLARFEQRFHSFLELSRLRPFLLEMALFFGVDPDSIAPARLHLMALPGESGTHAQANDRHLLMEIRPTDIPVWQIQVIAHEMAHYLWSQVEPERKDLLARQAYASSEEGAVLWRLLREGLPTAMGQGLAEARLASSRFSLDYSWYHIDVYDRFAKAIYPALAAAFEKGERIEDGLFMEIGDRAKDLAVLREPSPDDYLADVMFAVGGGMFVPLREIRSRSSIQNEWRYALSDPEGEAFLNAFTCLSGVVLLGPQESADLAALPALFRPPSAGAPSSNGGAGSGADPGRSLIHAVRRPGGGILFYIAAARQEDAARLAEMFLGLQSAPLEPLFLDPPP